MNWASLDLFNYVYGLREEYQPGRPIPLVAFGFTQKVLDDLQVFITDPTILSPTNGIAPLPSDYVHWSKIETTNDGLTREIKVVQDAHWNFRRNRVVAAPTTESPVCRIFNNQVEFLPTTLLDIKLTYLKTPTKAVFAFTLVNDRPVYDDANSVDFEWGEDNHIDIIARTLKFLGINLEDETLRLYSAQRVETGE